MFDAVAYEYLIARLAAQRAKTPKDWERDSRAATTAWHRAFYAAVAVCSKANAALPTPPIVVLPSKPWKR